MIIPTLDQIVAINTHVKYADEDFAEPDDLKIVEDILNRASGINNPIDAASFLLARIAKAQAFAEGNKRTARCAAYLTLKANGVDPTKILPRNDIRLNELLVRASVGEDIHERVVTLMRGRLPPQLSLDLVAQEPASEPEPELGL